MTITIRMRQRKDSQRRFIAFVCGHLGRPQGMTLESEQPQRSFPEYLPLHPTQVDRSPLRFECKCSRDTVGHPSLSAESGPGRHEIPLAEQRTATIADGQFETRWVPKVILSFYDTNS